MLLHSGTPTLQFQTRYKEGMWMVSMENTYDFDLNLDVARKIPHLIHSVFPRISHFPLIAMFD